MINFDNIFEHQLILLKADAARNKFIWHHQREYDAFFALGLGIRGPLQRQLERDLK